MGLEVLRNWKIKVCFSLPHSKFTPWVGKIYPQGVNLSIIKESCFNSAARNCGEIPVHSSKQPGFAKGSLGLETGVNIFSFEKCCFDWTGCWANCTTPSPNCTTGRIQFNEPRCHHHEIHHKFLKRKKCSIIDMAGYVLLVRHRKSYLRFWRRRPSWRWHHIQRLSWNKK